MFDLGFAELMVIGVVALIVVGPKDLPHLFRRVGEFVGKARGMARDFSRAMNDAADDTGLRDVTKTLNAAARPVSSAMDGVKDAASSMTNIDPDSETGKLSAERAEKKRKIEAASARAAAERKAREAKEAMEKAQELEAALEPKADAPAPDAAPDAAPDPAPQTKSET